MYMTIAILVVLMYMSYEDSKDMEVNILPLIILGALTITQWVSMGKSEISLLFSSVLVLILGVCATTSRDKFIRNLIKALVVGVIALMFPFKPAIGVAIALIGLIAITHPIKQGEMLGWADAILISFLSLTLSFKLISVFIIAVVIMYPIFNLKAKKQVAFIPIITAGYMLTLVGGKLWI